MNYFLQCELLSVSYISFEELNTNLMYRLITKISVQKGWFSSISWCEKYVFVKVKHNYGFQSLMYWLQVIYNFPDTDNYSLEI